MSMSMEAQLAEYRARRRREALINATKRKIISMVSLNINQADTEPLMPDAQLIITEGDSNQPADFDTEDISFKDILNDNKFIIMCFTFWVVVFMVFVHFQWGAVFFVLSALVFIYANTRTRTRRYGEVSAYSVFNKDCKTIDGQLTAEQFEKELRFGPGSVT
ncbi:SAYSVFN motif domain containing 1 [Arctopsyche grandis]|uniref:SAYSVFN motif domain containing 1 n=1 Tax=Arctopsyche grandis TaxID=121162 RepID=UPI00406D981D